MPTQEWGEMEDEAERREEELEGRRMEVGGGGVDENSRMAVVI